MSFFTLLLLSLLLLLLLLYYNIKTTQSECAFGLSPETLLHVVAESNTYLNEGRFTWRHDSVLKLIASMFKPLNCSKLYAELPGYMSPSVITRDTLRSDLVLTTSINLARVSLYLHDCHISELMVTVICNN